MLMLVFVKMIMLIQHHLVVICQCHHILQNQLRNYEPEGKWPHCEAISLSAPKKGNYLVSWPIDLPQISLSHRDHLNLTNQDLRNQDQSINQSPIWNLVEAMTHSGVKKANKKKNKNPHSCFHSSIFSPPPPF